jgi:hypothetical protein
VDLDGRASGKLKQSSAPIGLALITYRCYCRYHLLLPLPLAVIVIVAVAIAVTVAIAFSSPWDSDAVEHD